ncbi:MAG: hypothetical protein IJS60_02185 [Abditibacteriota bacterium]|nr:hypothetical protein [Abditibacteriota bacterium]
MKKLALLVTFIFVLFSGMVFGKEFTFQYDDLDWTVIMDDYELIGQPIVYRVIVQNNTEKPVNINDISSNHYIVDINVDKNYKLTPWIAAAIAKRISPNIKLDIGKYRSCDYVIYPNFNILEYKKYGFPTGLYSLVGSKFFKMMDPFLEFQVINNHNTYMEDLYFLNSNLLKFDYWCNIEPIYNKYLSIQKSKNESLIIASKYYFLEILSHHIFMLERQNPKVNRNNIYELNSNFKGFETECREFIKEYPDAIYYTQEVKKLLFKYIGQKSKEDFDKLLNEEYEYFYLNNHDWEFMIDDLNKIYKK